jgi:hypothetical protein
MKNKRFLDETGKLIPGVMWIAIEEYIDSHPQNVPIMQIGALKYSRPPRQNVLPPGWKLGRFSGNRVDRSIQQELD